MTNKPTEYSIQTLKNLSADVAVSPPIPREGIMGKGADGAWYNIGVNVDGTMGQNASMVLGYTDGALTTITKTINGTSYTKTLTYTDGNLTGVSAWT